MALLVHVGPGPFFLAILAGGLFLVAMPLLQLGLLALPAFRQRHEQVAVIALAGIAALVTFAAASGMFSFW